MNRVWILPFRSDPETSEISMLLDRVNEYAVSFWSNDVVRYIRQRGGYIYAIERTDWPDWAEGGSDCEPNAATIIRIDHHAPGDPGYGRPPAEFLPASSIGQVISELARLGVLREEDGGPAATAPLGTIEYLGGHWGVWCRELQAGEPCAFWRIPEYTVYVAAADHCLAAAYRGECPGVDPDALMRWRAETRAAYQGRRVEDLLADVERAREALRKAPVFDPQIVIDRGTGRVVVCTICGGDPDGHERGCPLAGIVDMRGRHVPELPEASAREQVCFIADGLPGPDRRSKIVCQSGTPEQIRAFMRAWAPANGLTDIYGDPARGFAGAYVARR